jgi:hypothetical protein
MEKLVYLVERGDRVEPDVSSKQILEAAREDLIHYCEKLTVNVWDGRPEVRALAQHYATHDGTRQLHASISIWQHCLDRRRSFEAALSSISLPFHGYSVTESVLRDYPERRWRLGDRSPGLTLVAAFQKPARMDERDFYRLWQEGHSRLALEIHPLSRYVRNSVARSLGPDAPPFAAIVEERVATLRDMAPSVFFSGRQKEAGADLAGFVDVHLPGQIRIEIMSEYIICD